MEGRKEGRKEGEKMNDDDGGVEMLMRRRECEFIGCDWLGV